MVIFWQPAVSLLNIDRFNLVGAWNFTCSITISDGQLKHFLLRGRIILQQRPDNSHICEDQRALVQCVDNNGNIEHLPLFIKSVSTSKNTRIAILLREQVQSALDPEYIGMLQQHIVFKNIDIADENTSLTGSFNVYLSGSRFCYGEFNANKE